MRAAAVTPARKPAAAVRSDRCYCGHGEMDHHAAGGSCQMCGCRRYQPRPCVCGHGVASHAPACREHGCDCKRFREDATPEFLLRRGVRAGEWQFITVPQLEWLMRPDQDQTVRVWACGMLHAIGQRGRMAVKVRGGKLEPLTPADIVAELNARDPLGEMTRQNCRRALAELERAGASRRVGRTRNRIKLFFYTRPLQSKTIPEDDDPGIVVKSDYKLSTTDTKESDLLDEQISHIQSAIVKTFMRALRSALAAGPDAGPEKVVRSDYKRIVEESLSEVMEVAKSAYKKLLLVVRSDYRYKEDSIYSSNGSGRQAGKPTATLSSRACLPADTDIQAAIPEELCRQLHDTPGPALLAQIRASLDGAPLAHFTARIRARLKHIASLGVLPALAGDVARAWRAGEASRAAEQAAAAARDEQRLQEAVRSTKEMLADPFLSADERATILEGFPELSGWRPPAEAVRAAAASRVSAALCDLRRPVSDTYRRQCEELIESARRRWPGLMEDLEVSR
jgi:hypothetical protein